MHGEVAAVRGGVLGTRGDDHTASRRVFALGSCLYAGGLARIDMDGGWRWRRGLSTGGRPELCGERMAAAGGLVAFTEGPESEGGHESEITVVEAENGSVRAHLPIRAAAVDLVVGSAYDGG